MSKESVVQKAKKELKHFLRLAETKIAKIQKLSSKSKSCPRE